MTRKSQEFSEFEWMAPGLVRAGLLTNADWVVGHAREASTLFEKGSRDVRLAAIGMAACHVHGLDYIKQAVALPMVAQIESSGDIRTMKTRTDVISKFRNLCREGVKLRDMLAAYGLPYPLRLITNPEVSPFARMIRYLGQIDPSTLAQIIPTHDSQPRWCAMLATVGDVLGRRWRDPGLSITGLMPDKVRLFRWAAMNADDIAAGEIGDILDYAIAVGDDFNFKGTAIQAREASTVWHRQTAELRQEQGFFGRHGLKFDQKIDYAPLPESLVEGEIEAVALRSGLDLYEEGRAMHHCVGNYSSAVINGASRIYSIRRNGKPEATLELVRALSPSIWIPIPPAPKPNKRVTLKWVTLQLKGPTNQRVTKKDVLDVVKKLITNVEECEREAAALGANIKDGKKAGG